MRSAAHALEIPEFDAGCDEAEEARPPRVLLVEDEGEAAESLSALLRLNGFEVVRACDGPTALLAARGGDIDAVVLDVLLPGMDGFEVCRRLRTDPATAALVIVMLTGLGDTGSTILGLNGGADEYLVKPVPSMELGTRVRKLLEARDARLRQVRQERTQAIGEVATAICRDISGPLTAALGSVDLLLMSPALSARIRRELECCQGNLVRIGQILRRLDFAQNRAVSRSGSDTIIDSGTAGAA
jgi:CheY-like chemotaxis protein